MKKVLLIEDRTIRQQLFFNETNINLLHYDNIVDNCINEKYNLIINDILQDNSILNNYNIIISHKSAFEDYNEALIIIQEHCKTHNKPLVLFSGGIDANYYNSEIYEVLELNSKTFYSQNLILFLDDIKEGNQNLLILCYGEKWRLNIALNTVEQLNNFIENEEKLTYRKILRVSDIDKLNNAKIKYNQLNTENTNIREEATRFKNSIIQYIEESINE